MKFKTLIEADFQRALLILAELDMPVETSYKIAIILENCEIQLHRFQKIRLKLLKKYSAQPGEARYIFHNKEEEAAYERDYQKLLNIEINLGKIALQDLGPISIPPFVIKVCKEHLLTI